MVCKDCPGDKSIDDFYIYKSGRAMPYCKVCWGKRTRARALANPERTRGYARKWAEDNRTHVTAVSTKWRKDNYLYYNEWMCSWSRRNEEKVKGYRRKQQGALSERQRRRELAKVKAVPPWLTKIHVVQMQEFYRQRPANYTVDHILPIQGKQVCGLHVPWNLQYLTQPDNSRKSNKFDGTYDNESWRKVR